MRRCRSAHYIWPRWWLITWRVYPNVHVELVLNDRVVDPIEEGFDVTVRIGTPVVMTSLIAKEIVAAQRVLCASPAYLKEYGEPLQPGELKVHRCLHYGYQASGSQWRLNGADGEFSVPINCVIVVQTMARC